MPQTGSTRPRSCCTTSRTPVGPGSVNCVDDASWIPASTSVTRRQVSKWQSIRKKRSSLNHLLLKGSALWIVQASCGCNLSHQMEVFFNLSDQIYFLCPPEIKQIECVLVGDGLSKAISSISSNIND